MIYSVRTVIKNECQDWNLEVTVWMSNADWSFVKEVYETYNDEGTVKDTSVVKECIEYDWDYEVVTACTFLLGYIDNYDTMGLSSPDQRSAGWLLVHDDAYGISGY